MKLDGHFRSGKKLLIGLVAGATLTACGGGGSSSSEPSTHTGVLIDSPVSGVSYATATHSGVTDERGRFQYEQGETD